MIENYKSVNVTIFNNIMSSWLPILDRFQRCTTMEEAQKYQQVVDFVTEKVSCGFVELLLGQLGGLEAAEVGFQNDDTLIEHLETTNTKSIKEVLRLPIALSAAAGNTSPLAEFLVLSLKEAASALLQPACEIQKCY